MTIPALRGENKSGNCHVAVIRTLSPFAGRGLG